MGLDLWMNNYCLLPIYKCILQKNPSCFSNIKFISEKPRIWCVADSKNELRRTRNPQTMSKSYFYLCAEAVKAEMNKTYRMNRKPSLWIASVTLRSHRFRCLNGSFNVHVNVLGVKSTCWRRSVSIKTKHQTFPRSSLTNLNLEDWEFGTFHIVSVNKRDGGGFLCFFNLIYKNVYLWLYSFGTRM